MIDEEVGYITGLGMTLRLGERVDSLKALLAEGYDAIFVGSGAPRGRDLDIPGRQEAAANIHIGIDWLSSVSFGHVDKIGKRVIVLGGGNTAMDCCRTSRRLGGEDVKVIVRSGFDEMKASPWEKEDAMHEDIPILNFLVPKEFTHDERQADRRACSRRSRPSYDDKGRRQLVADRRAGPALSSATTCWWRSARRTPSPGSSATSASSSTSGTCRWSTRSPWARPIPKRVLRRRRRVRAQEHHLGRGPRPRGGDLDRQAAASGEDVADRPPPGVTLVSQKMGIHEWSYDNDISNDLRYRVPLRDKAEALQERAAGGRARVRPRRSATRRPQRCLNCDVQTVFADAAVHRVRRLRRHLPDGLHHLHRQRRGGRPARAAEGAGAEPDPGPLRLRRSLTTGRVMVKDEDVCLHCGLCAERCPTGAWDMQQVPARHDPGRGVHAARGTDRCRMSLAAVNDFVVKFANVNGSGSASANGMFAKSILRMGVPVAARNIFPSNIQGLPTWYEVRVSEAGHLGRRGGVDLMVAMNPQTWDQDVASIEPGGYLFYDSTKPLPPSKFRDDINVIGVPLTAICNARLHRPAPAAAVQEHHLRRRAGRTCSASSRRCSRRWCASSSAPRTS